MSESDLIYSDLTRKIIGAAMEVHKILGHGFLENVYEEALSCEFKLQNITFEKQKNIDVIYKGYKVKEYICDFIAENKVVIELKAINKITNNEAAQVINYLKATGCKIGLLINFGGPSLDFKRFAF